MSGCTRYTLLAMLVGGLLNGSASAVAQNGGESPSPPRTSAEKESGDLIYRKDENGRPQFVPVGEVVVPSITDLLKPAAGEDAGVPDSFISRLSIAGTVVDDWASLTAEIEIRVVADERWLRVPLRFDQGLLLDYQYSGSGKAAPAVGDSNSSGLVWLIHGKGEHKLTLSLRVPLRRTANGSQLQLSLPERSQYFSAELRLRLPPDSFVEPGEAVHLLGDAESESKEIRALLTGDRIDLRWHPVVEETTPISRTVSNITVRLHDDQVQYAARQEIRLRVAGLPYVDVRLPSTAFAPAKTVRLNELNGSERVVTLQASDQQGWVRVPLDGVTGPFVRLDWLFEMPFDESTSQLTIDGLEVAGADDQSGTVSIEGFDRHLLTRRPDAVEGVSRIGVDELPAAGAFANLAYRFQSGGFRLVLDVDPIESTYRAMPIYVLELSKTRARLSTRFLMSIDEGQVDALSLVWPQSEDQEWTIEPLAIGGGEVRRDEVTRDEGVSQSDSESQVPSDADSRRSAASRWLLKPSTPLTNQAQTGFAAERTLAPMDDQARFSLRLPSVSGARTLPGICIVATGDEVEATVNAVPGTILRAQREVPEDVRDLLEDLGDRGKHIYSLQQEADDVELAIEVDIKVQQMQIAARSELIVDQIETDPQITQRFDFDVQFGRLASVRLQVPEEVVAGTREEFRDDALSFHLAGEVLPAVWRGTVVEVSFPQPQRGRFQVVAGPYRVPSMPDPQSLVQVPVMTLLERSFDSLRLSVPASGAAAIEVKDEHWTPLRTVVGADEWITSESIDRVKISLDHSLERVPQRVSMRVAWLQTQIDETGRLRSLAQYEVGPGTSQLIVQLPEEVNSPVITWNGQPMGHRQVRGLPEIPGQFLMELPERIATGWLGITYVQNQPPLGWSRTSTIRFPSFGENVVLEHTFWDLELPVTHHLLQHPRGLAPQFEWTRSGIVWSRKAVPGVADLRESLIASGATSRLTTEAANTYTFATLGRLDDVHVTSMSNALLVFFGAGLTLAASFLVLKVPAARNVWLWLTFGLIVTFASLWYLDALLLLLQPAVYGLLLPLVAVLVDRATEHKTLVPETLSTGQSFELTPTGPEGSDSDMAAGREAVPSTLVRPKALSDSGVS